jgi:hypothetical protein
VTSLFDLIARLWRGEAATAPEPEAPLEPKRRTVETEMVVIGDLDRDEHGAHRETSGSAAASPVAATVAAVAGGAFVLGAATATHHAHADTPAEPSAAPTSADHDAAPPADDPGASDHAAPSSDAAPADVAHHDGDGGFDHGDGGGDLGGGSGGDTFG